MTEFGINEYVWDRLRDGPGVVVGIDEGLELPYCVAEIIGAKKLGRVGYRKEESLCRYVKLIVPEDEAISALGVLDQPRALDKSLWALDGRIRDALRKRGVEW